MNNFLSFKRMLGSIDSSTKETLRYLGTFINMVNQNKGSLDLGVMTFSYIQALKELQKAGIQGYKVIVYDGKEHDVVIEHHIEEINNFIKRKIILDLTDKESVKKAIKEGRFIPDATTKT